MLRTWAISALLLGVLSACEVGDVTGGLGGGGGDDDEGGGGGGGGGGGAGPDGAPPASLLLAVGAGPASINLGTTATFEVSVTSDYYQGQVALTFEGAPETWNVSLTP